MKRTILLMAIAVAMVLGAKAQTATLQQGGNTTAYYGSDAFKEAYLAAKSGAVITLPDFGDASPKNINWAGAPTSDYRKLHKIFF